MSDRPERSAGVPPAAIRMQFAKRLQDALNDRGWTQSEFARRVAKELPDSRVGRDNISKYVRGKVLPLPPMLAAMCKVLEMESRDLLPMRARRSDDENAPFAATQMGDGRMRLRINQPVDWVTGLKIMAMLPLQP
jgi:transcriptional regulator with XRE-family HTH domain